MVSALLPSVTRTRMFAVDVISQNGFAANISGERDGTTKETTTTGKMASWETEREGEEFFCLLGNRSLQILSAFPD